MEPLVIPEVILLNAFNNWLRFVRNDYKANLANLNKSYLGQILGSTNALERYTFLEQCRSVFITNENTSPRNLEFNIFFNAKRLGSPTIHITNSSDNSIHQSLSIGHEINPDIFDDKSGVYTKVFNRRFQCKYNLVITSENVNEVLLIYTVLRSATISLIEHLQLSGLEMVVVSGQEIRLDSSIVPTNVFSKAIGISFEMDVMAPQLKHEVFFNAGPNFIFQGSVDESEELE